MTEREDVQMKQRYTLTIADMEINVISEESPESVESLVGNVDRKIREILVSSRRCSRGEAALLCALEYCSDKSKALRRVKQHEMAIYEKDAEIDRLRKEIERLHADKDRLQMELDTMRESLLAAKTTQAEERIAAVEVAPEETPAEAPAEAQAEATAETAEETAAATETPVEEASAVEAPTFEAVREEIAPEDVDFDPTEIFRRAKANRMIRKSQKKKSI